MSWDLRFWGWDLESFDSEIGYNNCLSTCIKIISSTNPFQIKPYIRQEILKRKRTIRTIQKKSWEPLAQKGSQPQRSCKQREWEFRWWIAKKKTPCWYGAHARRVLKIGWESERDTIKCEPAPIWPWGADIRKREFYWYFVEGCWIWGDLRHFARSGCLFALGIFSEFCTWSTIGRYGNICNHNVLEIRPRQNRCTSNRYPTRHHSAQSERDNQSSSSHYLRIINIWVTFLGIRHSHETKTCSSLKQNKAPNSISRNLSTPRQVPFPRRICRMRTTSKFILGTRWKWCLLYCFSKYWPRYRFACTDYRIGRECDYPPNWQSF